jgi:hypothetical protein
MMQAAKRDCILEDVGDMFLRNVGRLSTNYIALYPRR